MANEQQQSVTDLPADVQAMLGKPLYVEQTEFPIEMGYVYNTCAAVQNGNPLFWDAQAAQDITNGQIAPPTMLSVWFRPHYWAPGATGERAFGDGHVFPFGRGRGDFAQTGGEAEGADQGAGIRCAFAQVGAVFHAGDKVIHVDAPESVDC